MLIKDPSRFEIRNVCSKDCVELYQLIKQCYLEILNNDQNLKKLNTHSNDLNRISYQSNLINSNRSLIDENDLNNNINNHINSELILLECFDEFVRCLGFGKRREQDKVLDCLLIKDLNENRIIAFTTYSYSYFSYVGKEIHMNHFYVRPEYRQNGFGKFLIKNLIKLAVDAKLNKIKYDVPRTCEEFCKFMQKLGAKNFTEDTGYLLFRMDLKEIEQRLKNKNDY